MPGTSTFSRRMVRVVDQSSHTTHRYEPPQPPPYTMSPSGMFLYILSLVAVPPDIDDSKTSGDITVSERDNVTLVCQATGQPEPRILWRREDGSHILLRNRPDDSESGGLLNLFFGVLYFFRSDFDI